MRNILATGLVFAAVISILVCSSAIANEWTNYSDIGPQLLQWEQEYGSLAQRHIIGTSVQGRQIWAIKISDNVNAEEDEPEFKYVSAMHGDEIVSVKMCMMLIEYLLTNYGVDPQATNIVDEVELWIVPLMNPDGYDRSLRTRTNALGMDLNRDFPDYGEPNTPIGREPETQAIMVWTADHTFTASANFHCGALVMNYPFDNYDSGSNLTPDDAEFIWMSEKYSYYNQPMWNGEWYHGRTNGADWYVVHGGMQDWNYHFEGCNEITIEMSNTKEPAPSTIPAYWSDNRLSMMHYIETCLVGIRGLVTDGDGEPLACTVRVIGRDHDIWTDPDVGDYHRILLPGVYDLEFDAGAAGKQYRYGVIVNEGEATRVDVSFGPQPPIAYEMNVQANTGEPTAIALLATDPNNDSLDYIVMTLPSQGSLAEPGAGIIHSVPHTLEGGRNEVVYTSEAYVGEDGFAFKVDDGGTPPGGGDSNEAAVTLQVVVGPPSIPMQWLRDGVVNQLYGPVQLQRDAGTEPVAWSVLAGDQYIETPQGVSEFELLGEPRNWNDDDAFWSYSLPFTFPFFDRGYSSIRVCSNGFVDFGSFTGQSYDNGAIALTNNRMIAPLWDDLRTDGGGYDIYIDDTRPGEVTIRWDARTYTGGYAVNASVTLFDDGRIRFHYGLGNTGLSPTVGISSGDGVSYALSIHDGSHTLTVAETVEFKKPDGLPDGLELTTDGVLSGAPTVTGHFEPEFIVTDALDRTDARVIPLTILGEQIADGDVDQDGDVDLADIAAFQACFDRPSVGECQAAFEFISDGLINIGDFVFLAERMTPPVP